ncbi:MAG: recombination protein RecR [Chlamydiia bacterium]|nr:recombination protein RecR [Chlamydiia bacterium]
MHHYPAAIESLIETLRRLPGVGRRTAERYAFAMLDWQEHTRQDFARQSASLGQEVLRCGECGCLSSQKGCSFCGNPYRHQTELCIISSAKDAYAVEETGQFKGLYHVIGAPISPLDGRGPDALELDRLVSRVRTLGVQEVIVALDSTLEGDATALYISDALHSLGCRVTRLASGMPMGSSLQYVDGNTLTQAFLGRQQLAHMGRD